VLALGALTFVTTVISGMDYVSNVRTGSLNEARSRNAGMTADRSGLT